jgi:hypothetical protein
MKTVEGDGSGSESESERKLFVVGGAAQQRGNNDKNNPSTGAISYKAKTW